MLRQAAANAATTNNTPGERARGNGNGNKPSRRAAAARKNTNQEGQVLLPVSDVVLLCSTINPIDDCETPEGFERLPEDLNFGTGGRFVYLCIRRGPGAPVSEIEVLISSTPDRDDTAAQLKPGFTKLPVNVNEGAEGGHFVYLAVRRGGAPINDVRVLLSSGIHEDDAAEHSSKPTLYMLVAGNLNHGSSIGRFVRLAVSRVMRGVYTWGRNHAHQLGHEGTAPETTPRVVQSLYAVRDMRMVACGAEHTLALAADGHVFAWGCGRNGRLGNAACKTLAVPVQLREPFDALDPPSPVVFVSAGTAHSACLTRDGRAFAWGCGAHGRLGVGKLYDHYLPTAVHHFDDHMLAPQVRVLQVSCGDKHTLLLVREKATGDESIATCGCNDHGQLGRPHVYDDCPIPRIVQFFDPHKVAKVHSAYSGCGVLSDKGLFVFGHNSYGAMGVDVPGDEMPDVRAPTQVKALAGIAVVDFEIGQDHSIALSAEGQVYCWGRGDCGRLGTTGDAAELKPRPIVFDGSVESVDSRTAAERTSGVGPPGTAGVRAKKNKKADPGKKIVAVAVGAQHSGAVAADGTLFTWGRGTHGRLGSGAGSHVFAPTPIAVQVVHRVLNGRKFLVGKVLNLSLGKDHSAVCVARLDRFKELFGQKKSKLAINVESGDGGGAGGSGADGGGGGGSK